MSTDAAKEIVDLAFTASPTQPGYYLLGLAVGMLQAEGRSLTDIQGAVGLTFATSWDEAQAAAEALDREKGDPS